MFKIQDIKSDLDKLKCVVMCKPKYLRFDEPIDSITKYWIEHGEKLNSNKCLQEFEKLIDILKSEGIEIYFLPEKFELPYQVYTRDLGLAINNNVVILSKMFRNIRKPEVYIFRNFLRELNKAIIELPDDTYFEGGNAIIYSRDLIFIGISERTNFKAINFLKNLINSLIIPVKLPRFIIHLDLIMNFPSRNWIVLYKDLIPENIIQFLKRELQINIFEIDSRYWIYIIPNFLPIKDGKIIANEIGKEFLKYLEYEGIDVIYIPYSEISKCGGGIRCSVFPLERY